MKKEVIVRRSMHCLIALSPAYFLLPEDLPFVGVDRWVVLVAFLSALSVFDFWRRMTKRTFFGLRPHEKANMASFAWAAIGIVFVLWFIPKGPATAALFGMAFVDPLAGEMRSRYGQKALIVGMALGAYLLLAFLGLSFWHDHEVPVNLSVALLGAAIAIPSEAFKTKYIDDDFAMLVYPAMAMALLAHVL